MRKNLAGGGLRSRELLKRGVAEATPSNPYQLKIRPFVQQIGFQG